MVKHIVFWKSKQGSGTGLSQGQALEMKTRLEALSGRVPGLLKIEVGVDFGRSAVSSDIALYSELTDRAALEAYQKHPEHLAVSEFIGSLGLDRSVVDYEV